MKTGSVSFSARAIGLQVTELLVESDHPNIESFVCTISEEGHLELQVELKNLYYEDWPNQRVILEAQQLVAILSLHYDCRILGFRLSGHSIEKNDGSKISSVLSSHVAIWDTAEATIRPDKNSIENFQSRCKELRHSPFPKIYSAALSQQDSVTRFMFFYNTILNLAGDRQDEVDRLILRIARDTPTSASPQRPSSCETIYTRLRNEIAHNREGATFDSTSSEISERVSRLGEITKRLILEMCQTSD